MEERGSTLTVWVIDASVIGPLLIADEADRLHPGLVACLLDTRAVVPGHWRLEVASLGRIAVRRGRLAADDLAAGLTALAAAPPTEDSETAERAWSDILKLSERHGLTVYDAAYLELALRRRLPLLTADRELYTAARAAGIELVAE